MDSTKTDNKLFYFKGSWDPRINSPTLNDNTGEDLDVYGVIATGSIDLGSGLIHFRKGDCIVYKSDYCSWFKIHNDKINVFDITT